MTKPNILIGTLSTDPHLVGGWILSRAFREAGYGVSFLRESVDQEELVSLAKDITAAAILVSSSSGACRGLRERCLKSGLRNIILFACVSAVAPFEGRNDWFEIERHFQEIGFDRVFTNAATVAQVIRSLEIDLEIRRSAEIAT